MKTYQLGNEGGTFLSDDGGSHVIVISHLSDLGAAVFLSEDGGASWRQLFVAEYHWNGELDSQQITCLDPRDSDGWSTFLDRCGDVVICGAQSYTRVNVDIGIDTVIDYEPVPIRRVGGDTYQLGDGNWLHQGFFMFSDFRLGTWAYFGPSTAMSRAKVTGSGYKRMPRIEIVGGTLHYRHNGHSARWYPTGDAVGMTAMLVDPDDINLEKGHEDIMIIHFKHPAAMVQGGPEV